MSKRNRRNRNNNWLEPSPASNESGDSSPDERDVHLKAEDPQPASPSEHDANESVAGSYSKFGGFVADATNFAGLSGVNAGGLQTLKEDEDFSSSSSAGKLQKAKTSAKLSGKERGLASKDSKGRPRRQVETVGGPHLVCCLFYRKGLAA